MFKFSIRDLMFLTVIAAVLTAWLVDHSWLVRQLYIQTTIEKNVKR